MHLIIDLPKNYLVAKSDHHDKYKIFEYLINHYNYEHVDSEKLLENNGKLKDFFINTYQTIPQSILTFTNFSILEHLCDELAKITNIVIILCDIHHGKSIKKYRQPILLKCKYVLNNYGYIYEKYFSRHNGNIFFPHAVAYDIPFNQNPIKKILLTGHLNKDIYPNRTIMFNKSKQNNNIVYYKPDYENYRIKEKDINKTFGIKFYQLLNKYLCCVTDDANNDRPYIVAKFFEIIGSGALLLAFNQNTKKEFELLGFIDGVHYISCNCNNIDEKINYILDVKNIDKINKIRLSGYNFAQNHHSYKQRAQFVNDLLNNNVKLNCALNGSFLVA